MSSALASAPRTKTHAKSTVAASGASLATASAFYSKFTDGKQGSTKAKATPVVIGFMNDQGGVPSFPESTAAAKAAVKFVNAKLGGVGGHPVQLSTCLVTSEPEGGTCAEQFLSKKVPLIIEGGGNIGGTTFHQTIAGKIPTVIADPASSADASAKNAYGVSAAVYASDSGYVAYATQILHAKTASLLYPGDDPTGQVAAQSLEAAFKKVGITVTASGYSSGSADMLPAVVASGATHTDMTLALFVQPSTCIAGAKALQQANVTAPIVGLQLCIAPPVKQALGDYPKWTYISDATNPLEPEDTATRGYLAAMQAFAGKSANIGGQAQEAFSSVMFAVRAMNRAGGAKASRAGIAKQMSSFTGPMPMMAPSIKYDAIPGLTTIPSLACRLFAYKGGGRWTDVTHGKWIVAQ
jgi:branched-chain amino acid transport system substrate-binding protein